MNGTQHRIAHWPNFFAGEEMINGFQMTGHFRFQNIEQHVIDMEFGAIGAVPLKFIAAAYGGFCFRLLDRGRNRFTRREAGRFDFLDLRLILSHA